MGLLVGGACVRRLTGPHKPMSGTLIGFWLVCLPELFHHLGCLGNRGRNSCIVAGVKAIDRTRDAGQDLLGFRGGAVENEGCLQAFIICSKAEGLTAAPAKASHRQFAVARRQLGYVIGHSVQVGGNLLGRE